MRSARGVHKSGPRGSDQVLQRVRGIFKESDRVHACPAVATIQQRVECKHYPRGSVFTYTKDSDSENEDSLMPPLFYPEDSDWESLIPQG